MTKRTLFLWTILLTVCWGTPVWALLVPEMTTEELVANANTVVLGKCLSFHYHPDADGKTLYAIVQFKVDEYFKNNLGKDEIFLMQIAREENFDGTRKLGDVSFQLDEEAVLFLTEEDNQGFRHVLGLPQGKFAIRQNRKGERMILRDLTGIQFFNRKTGELSKIKPGREEKNFETFREELKFIASQLLAKKQNLVLVNPNKSP